MTERGGWIQTFSGKQFWPLDPRPDDVCVEDIAHALSMQCRFNGHTSRFYSVAEHSVLLAFKVPLQHRLAGLMHDAAEAYLCDLPTPIKRSVQGYAEAENRVLGVIAQKFGFAYPLPAVVKEADTRILLDERAELMGPAPEDWGLEGEPLGAQLRCWLPWEAEQAFLHTFWTLGAAGGRA